MKNLLPIEKIEKSIFIIRGQKVMLDTHLAELYGVPTKVLNQSVKRNLERFPDDFMFQLTDEETELLRSQSVTSNLQQGGRRYNPYVFTEHGVAMLSSVLKSKTAIQVNIAIIRAFIKLREMLDTHKDLARKLNELESRYDAQFSDVFKAIRQLMAPPIKEKNPIGFRPNES